MNTNNATASSQSTTTNVRKGIRKKEAIAMLKSFTFPSEPFTLRDLVTQFGANHWLVTHWAKQHGQVVGIATKTAGTNGKTRGPAAKLYKLPADKLVFKI
jgi:hypothetical protein